ncbi:hypothetical protein NT01CX_1998 [Clostridium novyi NT]|uniref:Uncharacterized protein n=1 Tax=Clostridium novyi (strain NT) TaxID=386415 RepID=A0Q0B9_CLONN|nr:hypothetical protein NT01CX_1998 [Clostridium novyi NT]
MNKPIFFNLHISIFIFTTKFIPIFLFSAMQYYQSSNPLCIFLHLSYHKISYSSLLITLWSRCDILFIPSLVHQSTQISYALQSSSSSSQYTLIFSIPILYIANALVCPSVKITFPFRFLTGIGSHLFILSTFNHFKTFCSLVFDINS